MRIKKLILLICIVFMVIPLAGCGEKIIEKDKTLRVGVVIYVKNDPFINAMVDCMKAEFQKLESDDLNIIMSVRSGEEDQRTQDEVVSEMIDAGCDVLCVNLVDRTSPSVIIELAKKNDIPVIFFNRELVKEDLMKWDRMYYVGADSEQSGELEGELAIEAINNYGNADTNGDGRIQYVLLEGEAGHQDAIIRTDYSVNTILNSGIKLDKISYQFADWNRTQAENKMSKLIEQYGSEIELVISNNDEMAMGAIDAYSKAGYSINELPIIIGIDGLDDAITAILEGKLQGTVYNDKEEQAKQISNLAVDLYLNNSLDGYDFQDGRKIILPYRKVDKTNVNEYISN